MHPLPKRPSYKDLVYVRRIAHLVSHRAAAYLATGIHALWCLRVNAERLPPSGAGQTAIACNGSVIEHYPSFRRICQGYVNELVALSGGPINSITLTVADESALYGAAVAASCLDD